MFQFAKLCALALLALGVAAFNGFRSSSGPAPISAALHSAALHLSAAPIASRERIRPDAVLRERDQSAANTFGDR